MDFRRADASQITDKARQRVLQTYGIAGSTPLAVGTEAEVYAYRPDSVLKIYADSSRYSYFETLRDFYAMLDARSIPFSLPTINRITRHDTVIATIERRVEGLPLEDKLPHLNTSQQKQAIRLYLDAVFQLRQITLTETPGTYLLFDTEQRSRTDTQSFNAFYAHWLQQKIERVGDYFVALSPRFEARARQLVTAIDSGTTENLSIVHGDFFPGNVLVDETLSRVCGVIDFGSFTLFGNYLLDVAGAFSFYRMYAPDLIQIRQTLLPRILERLPRDDHAAFFQYLLASAILTSDLYAPDPDPTGDGHFQWAADIVSNDFFWQNALP